MLSLLLLTLAAPQQAEAAPAAPAPAVENEALAALRKQAAALAEAKSYAFSIAIETSGMPGVGGGRGDRPGRGGEASGDRPGREGGETGDRPGRGGGETGDRPGRGGEEGDRPARGGQGRGRGQGGAEGDAAEGADDPACSPEGEADGPQPWKGVWQQGKPTLFQRGDIQAARDGRRVAMKHGEGAWQQVSFGRRGGGRRGGGGGFEPGPGGFDRELARPYMEVRALNHPHETLKTLLDALDAEQLEQDQALGLTVYAGPLSPEGAMRLATGGRGMGGRRGGDGPTLEAAGRARIAFAPEGRVVEIEIHTTLSGSFGERSFERKQAQTLRADQIGKAEAEIPIAVRAALEESEVGEEF